MAWDPVALARRRKAVLAQNKERWGKVRHPADEKSQGHHLENIQSFLEIAGGDAETAAPLAPSETHLRGLLENLHDEARNKPHPFQQETEEGAENLPVQQRRDLMAEIISAHFRSNMQTWLSTSGSEHDLSSTPIEEILDVQKEAQYRLKVLKTMVTLAEQETSALDFQIRAKRAAGAAPKNT